MCTIGLYYSERLSFKIMRAHIEKMLLSGEDRGFDATGLVFADIFKKSPEFYVYKEDKPFSKINLVNYNDFLSQLPNDPLLIFNQRAQPLPEGDSVVEANRQPLIVDGTVITHNGTIGNDWELYEKYNFKRTTDIDSEVIAHLFNKYKNEVSNSEINNNLVNNNDNGLVTAVKKTCEELSGGVAGILYTDSYPTKVFIIKNFKPLYLVFDSETKTLIVNSELKNIRAGFPNFTKPLENYMIRIPPYSGIIIDLVSFSFTHFDVSFKIKSYLPTPDPRKVVVVASGGMDSSTVTASLKYLLDMQPIMLHINYGQKAEEAEWEAVQKVSKCLGVECKKINAPFIGKFCRTPLTSDDVDVPIGRESIENTWVFVPARNTFLIALAASFAEGIGAKYLAYGGNLEEGGAPFSDCDQEFLEQYNTLLQYGTLGRIQLISVLEKFMKTEIVALGMYLSSINNNGYMKYTWSCDTSGQVIDGIRYVCGKCGCCHSRGWAFERLGIPDPQAYRYPSLEEQPIWMEKKEYKIPNIDISFLISKVKDGMQNIQRNNIL